MTTTPRTPLDPGRAVDASLGLTLTPASEAVASPPQTGGDRGQDAIHPHGRGRLRPWLKRGRRVSALTLILVGLLLLGPLSVLAFGGLGSTGDWRGASRASAGIAPRPAEAPEAIVQAYAARTIGWRGAFGVHTWIATKRPGADQYTIHHVLGWRVFRGGSAVVTQHGDPDFKWFGAVPIQLIDHRGASAESMIDQVEAAVASYRYADTYHAWPGPNSNTFVAHIARSVPALRLDLPANALGKDFLGGWQMIAPMPSGTGWQISLFGLAGIGLAREEGLEINLLGLSAGVDFNDRALRLPGYGTVALRRG